MAIVVVDDEAVVRQGARHLLERAGIKVVGEASNGAEALAVVDLLMPSAVLMDGRMPLMNGIVATRYLKALHPSIKVIAHSADTAMLSDLIAAGAVAVAAKGSNALIQTVRSALGIGTPPELRAGPRKL